jgi:hypothetical protein
MELKNALKELAEAIKKEILRRLHSPLGTNNRVGRNTLVGSNLEASIDVYQTDDDSIAFTIADYYMPIVAGRRAGWKGRPKREGTDGIIKAIERWVQRKGIRFDGCTETQTVWLVLESLEVRAIAARPFIGYDPKEYAEWTKSASSDYVGDVSLVLPFLDAYFDEWADEVYKLIVNKLDKYFQ